MEKKIITIYTDGACSGNPGPGGWAAILNYREKEKILSGWSSHTTNNRMELIAPLRAFENLNIKNKNHYEIHIFTDSQYLKNGITSWIYSWKRNNWKTSDKKNVKNSDLWKKLDEFSQNLEIKWEWVKGHADNPGNTKADKAAREALLSGQKGEILEDSLGLSRADS